MTVMELLKKGTVNEIVKYFSNKVNDLCFKPQKICLELKESQEMKILTYYWIYILSQDTYRFDGRNEYSSQIGKKLYQIPFIKEQIDYLLIYSDEKMKLVAEKMSYEHRTLQQSFSSIIFYHLFITCNDNQQIYLKENFEKEFFLTPLI